MGLEERHQRLFLFIECEPPGLERPALEVIAQWIGSFNSDRDVSPEVIALIARLIAMPGMAAKLPGMPATLVRKAPLREAFLPDMLALLEGETSRLPVMWLPEFVDYLGRVEASETEREIYGERWRSVLDTGSKSPMPVNRIRLIFAGWRFGVDPVPYLSGTFKGGDPLGAEKDRFEALMRGVCATHPNQRGPVLSVLAESVRARFEANPDMQADRAWAERVWAPDIVKDALLVLWLAGEAEQVEALIAMQPVSPTEKVLQQLHRRMSSVIPTAPTVSISERQKAAVAGRNGGKCKTEGSPLRAEWVGNVRSSLKAVLQYENTNWRQSSHLDGRYWLQRKCGLKSGLHHGFE